MKAMTLEQSTPLEKKEMSWDEYNKKVCEQVQEILVRNRTASFKFLGRYYLDSRLILYFNDCNQVFDFSKGETDVKVVTFYTKDKSHEDLMQELKEFKVEEERDVQEPKQS